MTRKSRVLLTGAAIGAVFGLLIGVLLGLVGGSLWYRRKSSQVEMVESNE